MILSYDSNNINFELTYIVLPLSFLQSERAKKGDEDIVPLLLPPSRDGRRPRSYPGSAEQRRRYSSSSATTAEEELSDRESLPEIGYDTQRHHRQLAKVSIEQYTSVLGA